MSEEANLDKIDLLSLVPQWMTEGSVNVYSSIDCVHIQKGSVQIALTRAGLVRFGTQFSSMEGLSEYLDEALKGSSLHGMESFKVPDSDPDIVIKQDAEKGSAIPTFLTLAALRSALPDHSSDYIFQPVDLYFAVSVGPLNVLAMEKVESLNPQIAGRVAINAFRTLINETRKVKLPIDATLQDMLMRGYQGSKPIIAIVDVQSPGLDSFLGNN